MCLWINVISTHIFYKYDRAKCLCRTELSPIFSKYFNITNFNTTDYQVLEFLIPWAKTFFEKKTTKSISIIFYLYLSYMMFMNSEKKKIIFVNNLKAKIQNDKRIEEEIVLVNSKKIIVLTKNWYLTNNIISVM